MIAAAGQHLDHLPLPSLLLDLRGHVVQCNAAARAVLTANADVLCQTRGKFVVLPDPAWITSRLLALLAAQPPQPLWRQRWQPRSHNRPLPPSSPLTELQ